MIPFLFLFFFSFFLFLFHFFFSFSYTFLPSLIFLDLGLTGILPTSRSFIVWSTIPRAVLSSVTCVGFVHVNRICLVYGYLSGTVTCLVQVPVGYSYLSGTVTCLERLPLLSVAIRFGARSRGKADIGQPYVTGCASTVILLESDMWRILWVNNIL